MKSGRLSRAAWPCRQAVARVQPPELLRHIPEQLALLGNIECRRFLGGRGFRCHGQQFAVAMRERLYLLVDDGLRRELVAAGSERSPTPRARAGSWSSDSEPRPRAVWMTRTVFWIGPRRAMAVGQPSMQ